MRIEQFDMLDGMRGLILEEHWFYVSAMKGRVFSQFADIDAEAESVAESKWQALINQPASEDDEGDLGSFAEEAQDAGIARYEMLAFLKREVSLGGIAGMYQLWERALRSFLEGEMRHWLGQEAKNKAWKTDIEGVFQLLASFGWNVKQEPFFEQLDACHLVVNAHKHGKGPALNQLAAKFPEYLRQPFAGLAEIQSDLPPEHDDVVVSEEQFLAFADAIAEFWKAFPKRLPAGEPA